MASLLRSAAIRRALSAASSGGSKGASIRRVPSAAIPALGGEEGATVPRGLALSTVPRRRFCAPAASGSDHANPNPDQVNVLLQKLKKLKGTMDKGFILCGCTRLLVEDIKPHSAALQWLCLVCPVILLSFVEQRTKSVK